jgi:hypothetical protein
MNRRPLDFRSIDEVIADLDRLRRGGYEKAGNWDLTHAANHLAIFVRGSLEGFTAPKAPWFIRLIGPMFVRRMIKKRRMPAGVKVPAAYHPAPRGDEKAEVDELKQLLLRFRDHRGPLFPSTLAGELDYDTWRELHLVHCSHHLSFLHPNSAVSS